MPSSMRMPGRFLSVCLLASLVGCAVVEVTKTSKGFTPPTDPNDIDILYTRPDRPFTEMGSVTVTGFKPSESAKMHNALRQKSAPLGASAVLLINTGINNDGNFWGTGVAIRYNTPSN